MEDISMAQLEELGKALSMSQFSGTIFEIAGHTDSRGDEDYNLQLSRLRAETVKNYVVEKFDIEAEHLLVNGFGETRPIAFNEDEESWAKNRRVVVSNLSKIPEDSDKSLSIEVSFLYKDEQGNIISLNAGDTLKTGQEYNIYFEPKQNCYVYVFQKDISGEVWLLFPNPDVTPDYSPENPAIGGKSYWIPGYYNWLTLNETIGQEEIFVFASASPSINLEDLITELKKPIGENKENLAQVIDEEIRTRGAANETKPGRNGGSNTEVVESPEPYTIITFKHVE
jgi:hypothetical protein